MASQTPTHGIRLTHLEREPLIAKHAGAKCNEAQEMWLGLEICLRYSFPEGSAVKETHLPMQEMQVRSLSQEDPLGKDMATHSSTLAWEVPWTEELRPMGSQRV